MQNLFDVVVVPDFSGQSAAVFEARTLFFLASWIEYSNAPDFPLHLACIGEPPRSVQKLAAQCNAQITVHAPLGIERRGTSNKLRGLEVRGKTARVLLLDADVLFLGNIRSLCDLGKGLAVSPENNPRVPQRYWEKIYPALGMEMPTERIPSVKWELGLPRLVGRKYAPQFQANMESMLPYYNSGIILAPWDCGLRTLWEENLKRIAAMFEDAERLNDEGWQSARRSDQAGLAVSVEQLKRRGLEVQRLPNAFHAHALHLYRRTIPLSEAKLFHAFRMFTDLTSCDKLLEGIEDYHRDLRRTIYGECFRHDRTTNSLSAAVRYLVPSLRECNQLTTRLKYLYLKYVRETLQQ